MARGGLEHGLNGEREAGEGPGDLAPPKGSGPAPRMVLGAIAGGIRSLGKDMARGVLRGHGFQVHDLGVDIAPEVFLAETIRRQPDIVGIPILMSDSCLPSSRPSPSSRP